MRRTVAVELNDSGIVAVLDHSAGGGGVRIGPSRGCALMSRDRLLVGAEAVARARIEPRRAYDRFWHFLDRSAPPRPYPQTITQADLVHAHLVHLRQLLLAARRSPDEQFDLLLAVPGSWSVEQLEWLLGVSRAAELEVAGLVDLAVATGATLDIGSLHGATLDTDPLAAAARTVLHLDLQLHQGVLSELEIDGAGQLVRRSVRKTTRVGRAVLEERWARGVAELFVRRTRFDPLHTAATEQALYDVLPRWLGELASNGRTTAELETSTDSHSIELTDAELLNATTEAYDALAALVRSSVSGDRAIDLWLTDRISCLPGFLPRVESEGVAVRALPSGAAAEGALLQQTAIRPSSLQADGALPLTVCLPLLSPGALAKPDGAP